MKGRQTVVDKQHRIVIPDRAPAFKDIADDE